MVPTVLIEKARLEAADTKINFPSQIGRPNNLSRVTTNHLYTGGLKLSSSPIYRNHVLRQRGRSKESSREVSVHFGRSYFLPGYKLTSVTPLHYHQDSTSGCKCKSFFAVHEFEQYQGYAMKYHLVLFPVLSRQ